jgi:phosphoenolpyruvate carboxykinase (ATP)
VLDPRQGWAEKATYDLVARELVRRFEANFEQFEAAVDAEVRAVALRAGA